MWMVLSSQIFCRSPRKGREPGKPPLPKPRLRLGLGARDRCARQTRDRVASGALAKPAQPWPAQASPGQRRLRRRQARTSEQTSVHSRPRQARPKPLRTTPLTTREAWVWAMMKFLKKQLHLLPPKRLKTILQACLFHRTAPAQKKTIPIYLSAKTSVGETTTLAGVDMLRLW